MSTKIYTAWRCRAGDLSPAVLPAFREHVFAAAAERVKALTPLVAKKTIPAVWRQVPAFAKKLVHDKEAFCRVRAVLQDAPDALDCSVNVWIDRGRAYLIPYGSDRLFDGFAAPGATDYSYWNNADPPARMTAARWARRERTWDRVCLDDWDTTRLVHVVIDGARRVGLPEVVRRVLPRESSYGLLGWGVP